MAWKYSSETGGKIKGLWTGGVKTKVKMSYLTIPVLANYRISSRWKVWQVLIFHI